jgi:hypothetical protein
MIGNFEAFWISLTSLQGSPKKVSGNFKVFHNQLKSLKYGPEYVEEEYDCSDNYIESLKDSGIMNCTRFNCVTNAIKSLEGIGKYYLKECLIIDMAGNPVERNILGLVNVKHLTKISYASPYSTESHTGAFNIARKHINGDRDILEFQEELIQAGLKEYAKL